MTTPHEDTPQWQQPSWQGPSSVASPADPPTAESLEPVAGAVLVPKAHRPPSVVESSINVLTAVAWPLAIVLAIMDVGGWALNIGAALVISILGGAISGELRKRRGKQ